MSTLQERQRKDERWNQDAAFASSQVHLVYFAANSTRIPLFYLHQRRIRIRSLFLHHLLLIALLLDRLFFFLPLLLLRAKLPNESGEGTFFGKKLVVGTTLGDAAVDDGVYVINLREEVESVGDQDTSLPHDSIEENVVEDRLADVSIQG